MAPSIQASGSTLNDGTELTLCNIGVAGVFQGYADLNPLASGDIIEFRVYMILKPSGQLRVLDVVRVSFLDVVADNVAWPLFDPIVNAQTDTNSVRYTMKQVVGTNRTIDWYVAKA